MKKKYVAVLFIVVVCFLSSCVSTTKVNFSTNVDPAELYIDGESKGKTPIVVRISNAIWDDSKVEIRKMGYKVVDVRMDKEFKCLNFVLGIVPWWPSMYYAFGPKEMQRIEMKKE